MSYLEKEQTIIDKRRSNDRKHEKKMAEELKRQEELMKKTDAQLKKCDAEIDNLMKTALKSAEEHRAKKLQSNESNLGNIRSLQMDHIQRISQISEREYQETAKILAREQENLKKLVDCQTVEEEQLNKIVNEERLRATEEIRVQKEEQNRQSENYAKRDNERIERVGMMRKENREEIREIQEKISESNMQEHAERKRYLKQLHSVKIVGKAGEAGMSWAKDQMSKNREASSTITLITDQFNTLQLTAADIWSKIEVANNLAKPELLKKQYSNIWRKVEDLLTSKMRIEDNMHQFQKTPIDENDDARNNIIGEVCKELLKLITLHETITMLAPKKSEEVDMKFVKNLLDAAHHGVTAIESAITLWNNLPKVDESDLVYKKFTQINEILINDAQLSDVKKLEMPL